jgi:hypothetical protein
MKLKPIYRMKYKHPDHFDGDWQNSGEMKNKADADKQAEFLRRNGFTVDVYDENEGWEQCGGKR